MLHKKLVAHAVIGSLKRKVRETLGIKPREQTWPILGLQKTYEHQKELAERFPRIAPASWNALGKHVCEVGCWDCLSMTALLLKQGATHVDLIEPTPPVVNSMQADILRRIAAEGVPIDPEIIIGNGKTELDPKKITYYTCMLEDAVNSEKYDYLFSYHVLEHVERLVDFYGACFRLLKPGGEFFHCIDFSGHGLHEDPVPPLDFQTYPDWLYELMYPRNYRATRFFPSEHIRAMKHVGLDVIDYRTTRAAEPGYLRALRPRLRPAAQSLPDDELGVLEAVIACRRPAR